MRSPAMVLILRLGVCAPVLFAASGAGDPRGGIPERVAAGYKAITEENLRANLGFIASDALQGRLSLQPGDEAATEWVASEFAKARLEPVAPGSYLQPVPLIEFRADRAESYVALNRDTGEKKWKYPEAYGTFPRDADVTGDLVFAGFGITAPELHYDDYQAIEPPGKNCAHFRS